MVKKNSQQFVNDTVVVMASDTVETNVGSMVGSKVGGKLGYLVGADVGSMVGSKVGGGSAVTVGSVVGFKVGSNVVGGNDGFNVIVANEGFCVGIDDGIDVGLNVVGDMVVGKDVVVMVGDNDGDIVSNELYKISTEKQIVPILCLFISCSNWFNISSAKNIDQ